MPSEEGKLTSALEVQNLKGIIVILQLTNRLENFSQELETDFYRSTKYVSTINSSQAQLNRYNILLCSWLAFYCKAEFA